MRLTSAIKSFPLRKCCFDPDFTHGSCDAINLHFMSHAESYGIFNGILLAVDNPIRDPTAGWQHWGGDWRISGAAISHYVAFYPAINLSIDFAARQFWHDCPVPLIQTLSQLQTEWNSFPFNLSDSRKHEDYL